VPTLNQHIFRAYDIRGLVETELTPEVVHLIGRAYGSMLRGAGGHPTVAVGRDDRPSSPALHASFLHGLLDTGCNTVDLGAVPTPVMYYAVAAHGFDGGAIVTGSHLAQQYNGIKLTRSSAITLTPEEIQALRQTIEHGDFAVGAGGTRSKMSVVPEYIDHMAGSHRIERNLTVVVDAGNGAAGPIAPEILRRLGCDVIEQHCDVDGTYPNHIADPELEENVIDLQERVVRERADLGVAFDGDVDRLGIVDENGRFYHADHLLLLLAWDLIDRHPNAEVLMDVKCSQVIADEITAKGGRPVFWKSGHSLMKAKLREDHALLGGEVSGHMFFAEDYYGLDDGILAACRLLQYLSRSPESLAERFSRLPVSYATPELRIPCPDAEKFRVVEEVSSALSSRYRIVDIDGVRIETDDGWALVRPSNTSPCLTARVEASSPSRRDVLLGVITSELRKYSFVDLSGLI
jgi:phosphomannomutase/phosphoglucomutase